MYIAGGVALLVFIFAVLMIFGVIPFTHQTVGAMFLGVCFGFAGPYFVKA